MSVLSPISPLDDQSEKVQAQQATHEDVERWVADPYLWGWITGQPTGTVEDKLAAMDRYPPLREAAEAAAQPYVNEFQWRLQSEGREAAVRWLQQQFEREGVAADGDD